MRHILKMKDRIEIIVEPIRSTVRLCFEFDDGGESYVWSLKIDPTEADQIAASLQTAALEIRLKRGDEERGPS